MSAVLDFHGVSGCWFRCGPMLLPLRYCQLSGQNLGGFLWMKGPDGEGVCDFAKLSTRELGRSKGSLKLSEVSAS